MKRFLMIGCMMLSAWCAVAQISGIHANDARFVYVGRTQVDSTSVSMDWTGTYVRVRFIGDSLCVRLSDTGRDYLNLYVDTPFSAEPTRIVSVEGDTTICLCTSEISEEHSIILYKRTEGEQGRLTFHEFYVRGLILQAEPVRERLIEFIGDSYTCGYGTENSTMKDHFTPETENSAKTYAAIVSRYFDADVVLIAHSGMGIVRNYKSKLEGWHMPDRYLQTFDMDSTILWAESKNQSGQLLKPSITIILLGGNDFSVGMQPNYDAFAENYQRLLRQIKANYGADYPILCCTKKGKEGLLEYVRRVVHECRLSNVAFCPFYPSVFSDDYQHLGADFHPNYEAQRKAAYVLIPYISTMTGWPLTDNPIR